MSGTESAEMKRFCAENPRFEFRRVLKCSGKFPEIEKFVLRKPTINIQPVDIPGFEDLTLTLGDSEEEKGWQNQK